MKKTIIGLIFGLIFSSQLLACDLPCMEKRNSNAGFYGSVFGGVDWMNKTTLKFHHMEYSPDAGPFWLSSYKFRFSPKLGYIVGGTIGYRFSPLYIFCKEYYSLTPRIEEELSYRHFEGKYHYSGFIPIRNLYSGSVSSISAMTNFLVDFNTPTFITPYLGGGIGYSYAFAKLKGKTYNHGRRHWNRFVYQGIVGCSISLFEIADITLDYKYLQGIDEGMLNQSVSLGIKRVF